MYCRVNGQEVACPEFLEKISPILFVVFPFLIFALLFLTIVGFWKVFKKAGKPGWASIIPIYNMVVLLEIVKRPSWWIILMFIPFVNFVVMIVVMIQLAKLFGKGTGFGVGLALLNFIFFPILGFGKAQYLGGGSGVGNTPNNPVVTI